MDAFEQITAALDYPMFVVTAAHGERNAGCLVGFASQCSIEPARVLVCLSKRNHTFRVVSAGAAAVAVHFLSTADEGLARLFGEQTGDEVDKFERCRWHPGPAGAPVIEGVAGWFGGRILERFDVGDHVALLLEPVAGEWRGTDGTRQFGFQAARHLVPGHRA